MNHFRAGINSSRRLPDGHRAYPPMINNLDVYLMLNVEGAKKVYITTNAERMQIRPPLSRISGPPKLGPRNL